MPNYVALKLKAETLARYGLPDIPYRLALDDLMAAMEAGDGALPFALMLVELQELSRAGDADWLGIEPGIDRLSELLCDGDEPEVTTAAGDEWWLEFGPVNLGGRIVTIQRQERLIAAIGSRPDGRLRVAVYRPLDGKSAAYLAGLGHNPHPEHGVCLRENNWEYALDCSAGNGNYYASSAGEAYLSYWEKGIGIGICATGAVIPIWHAQKDLMPRPVMRAVTEVGLYHAMGED